VSNPTTATATTTAAGTTATGPGGPVGSDPAFAQMVRASAGHVRAIGELTEREKTFLCVTADVCQSAYGSAFEAHVRIGLDNGVSTSDIRGLLRFIAYDSGYHVAAVGLEQLAGYEERHDIKPEQVEPLPDNLLTNGPGAAPTPLPEPIREQLRGLDPDFLAFFDLQSRMRSEHGPGTLSERERGFASLSIDVHYQTLGETFRAHVGRALRGGASREDVRAALRFNSLFGVTRAWHGWQALNAYFGELGTAERRNDAMTASA
jgi:alkylhydroperoxidase/carboxymuconolactone decarboxylase family protein YurZ